MSGSKASKYRTLNKGRDKNEWPVVVFFWIIGLALVSYIVARVVLDGYPHPYHWLSGLIGGFAGVPIGWLWYRWRGDVF